MEHKTISWFSLTEQEQKDEIERLKESGDTIQYIDMPQKIILKIVEEEYIKYLIVNKERLREEFYNSVLNPHI